MKASSPRQRDSYRKMHNALVRTQKQNDREAERTDTFMSYIANHQSADRGKFVCLFVWIGFLQDMQFHGFLSEKMSQNE